MDEEDDASFPSAAECDQRCRQFADVTNTDTALAMFYLQDRDWNLERALHAFFEERGDPVAAEVDPKDEAPNRLRLLTWNIDGLDKNNVLTRCKEVCRIIVREKPDVVYLQEVVPPSLGLIEETLTEYQVIAGGDTSYFTVVLLKKTSVVHKSHEVLPFSSSSMGRNLIMINAEVRGVSCVLMTSHLESTTECADERKRQLRIALQQLEGTSTDRTVLFGGDLNMRDKELKAVGGLPRRTEDVWEVTGRREEAKFTWDMQRNDNLNSADWGFTPRCRFDRLYLRSSQPPSLKPVYFELVGLERIPACHRFPSDHWGILAHFDKV